jgi:predicted metal-dependent phosphoesterase TrpH
MLYRADFHIHSCLSPCASLEMSPQAIVKQAQVAGLNAIALADHNCGFNLPAFSMACEAASMECLYGLEVTSVEEAHILCLFDDLDRAVEFGDQVYESLPPVLNCPERFGDQPVLDENEEILRFAEKFLISASTYSVSDLVEAVHERGGLCIPAHIDRQVFGIIAQLGFLPDEDFDAVELTARGNPDLAMNYPIVRNSDSHKLESVGSAFTEFEAETLSISAIRSSLRGQV